MEDLSEDYILSADLDDEGRFDLICSELANKNAKRILREIMRGASTSSLIAEKLELTVQDVLIHLDRLETIGLVEQFKTDQLLALRGRLPRQYRISKVAILMVPSSSEDGAILKDGIKKKSAVLLRNRFYISIASTIGFTVVDFLYLLRSVPRLFLSSNGGFQSPPPASGLVSAETWLIISIGTIVPSLLVYYLMRRASKRLIN